MEFEIRAEINPEGGGIKDRHVLFYLPKFVLAEKISYPMPDKEFRKIKLDLRRTRFKMADIRIIKIGLNFKDAAEGAIWIRNIAFTTGK